MLRDGGLLRRDCVQCRARRHRPGETSSAGTVEAHFSFTDTGASLATMTLESGEMKSVFFNTDSGMSVGNSEALVGGMAIEIKAPAGFPANDITQVAGIEYVFDNRTTVLDNIYVPVTAVHSAHVGTWYNIESGGETFLFLYNTSSDDLIVYLNFEPDGSSDQLIHSVDLDGGEYKVVTFSTDVTGLSAAGTTGGYTILYSDNPLTKELLEAPVIAATTMLLSGEHYFTEIKDVDTLSFSNAIKPLFGGGDDITPDNGNQGQANIACTLTGLNFIQGATVSFVKSGETDIVPDVGTTIVVDSNTITFTIDIPSGAATGAWDVEVVNPGGGTTRTGTLTGTFTVN